MDRILNLMDVIHINTCRSPLTNNEIQVAEYKEFLKTKAEELIVMGFPETIIKLNELLETPKFRKRELSNIHQDLKIPIPDSIVFHHTDPPPPKKLKLNNTIRQEGTKVMVLPCGSVPTNKNLIEVVEIVKPHIRKLVEDSNLLKMWVSFMIPKIEDGNNFGVFIQEYILTNVQSVESEAAGFYDQISNYFISRGKLISNVAKYPHVEDYRRAVEEVDEREYLSLCLVLTEIRNRYCSLHDVLIKNLDKIKKPRPTNATESLY